MPAEVVELFARSGLCLRSDGTVDVETPPRRSGDADGWLVACFRAASSQDVHSDYWEIHPAGQEIVAVLSGQARLILRTDGQAGEETVILKAGSAGVVPRNRWHRIEIDSPAEMQSVTPRRGTRVEPVA